MIPNAASAVSEACRNRPVIDLNLEIIHFPSGDGLGCPSSDGKYRDDDRRVTDRLRTRSPASRIYPNRPDEPLAALSDSQTIAQHTGDRVVGTDAQAGRQPAE